MFLVRRPSPNTIDRFLLESRDLPLSYGPVGIVQAETTHHDVDEVLFAIGHGKADFERARAALIAWKPFDIGWVETFPPHPSVAAGTVVAVLIRHLGFWSLNGDRVLYHVGHDDQARFGFAVGTLTNHAESGEELFEVFIDPRSDDVMYRIRAISRPRALLARVGQPIGTRAPGPLPTSLCRGDDARDAWHRSWTMSIYVEILLRAPMDALWRVGDEIVISPQPWRLNQNNPSPDPVLCIRAASVRHRGIRRKTEAARGPRFEYGPG